MTFRFYNNPVTQPPVAPEVPGIPDYENPDVLQQSTTTLDNTPDTTARAAKPVMDASQFLGGLLNTPAPAPKYDQQNEDYLNRMAKFNNLGNFLTLLSDTANLAKGAPVQPRQFKSSVPYLQSILENRERYNQKVGEFQTNEYNRKLQAAINLANQEAQRKQFEARQAQSRQQFQERLNFDKSKAETDAAYKDWLKQSKISDSEFARTKFKDESARGWASINKDEKNKPVKVQTSKQTYTLPREEFNNYLQEAYSDPNLRAAHPEWFSHVGQQQVYNAATGTFDLSGGREILNPAVKPEFLVQYYLEQQEANKGKQVVPAPGSTPSMFQKKSKLLY